MSGEGKAVLNHCSFASFGRCTHLCIRLAMAMGAMPNKHLVGMFPLSGFTFNYQLQKPDLPAYETRAILPESLIAHASHSNGTLNNAHSSWINAWFLFHRILESQMSTTEDLLHVMVSIFKARSTWRWLWVLSV